MELYARKIYEPLSRVHNSTLRIFFSLLIFAQISFADERHLADHHFDMNTELLLLFLENFS